MSSTISSRSDSVNNVSSPPLNPALAMSSSTGESSSARQRASAACLQCRRLKSKCRRGPDPSEPCERCKNLGTVCEIVKSRRGRVLGSRNKRTGLEQSLAYVQAALDKVLEDADLHAAAKDHLKQKRPRDGEEEAELVPHDGEGQAEEDSKRRKLGGGPVYNLEDPPHRLQDLPLSNRHSPDPESRRDTTHPLSLLSNVGQEERHQDILDDAEPGGDDDRIGASPEDSEVWPGWTKSQLRAALTKRQAYFRHQPGSVKRDVAVVLDPIARKIVTMEQAERLVEIFFKVHYPQIGFMDPVVATLQNLQNRSALLTTVVLATASQSQEGAKQLSELLYKHAESLLMTVLSHNAKSPEIIQALLVLSLFPCTPERIVDDRSRMLIALAVNMALDLSLNRERKCHDSDVTAQRWHRDKTRTWFACVIQDKSMSAYTGKPSMINQELSAATLQRWLEHPLRTPGDRMLTGFIELRLIERDLREQLANVQRGYMVEAVRIQADALLDSWIRVWVTPETDGMTGNMMRVLAHHIHLLITTASEAPREDIVRTARMSVQFALQEVGQDLRYICRTIIGMITWAAVLLIRLERDEHLMLVRDLALLIAPYGDGRFETSYAHFCGSFLLGLCLDSTTMSPLSGRGLHATPGLQHDGLAHLTPGHSSNSMDHYASEAAQLQQDLMNWTTPWGTFSTQPALHMATGIEMGHGRSFPLNCADSVGASLHRALASGSNDPTFYAPMFAADNLHTMAAAAAGHSVTPGPNQPGFSPTDHLNHFNALVGLDSTTSIDLPWDPPSLSGQSSRGHSSRTRPFMHPAHNMSIDTGDGDQDDGSPSTVGGSMPMSLEWLFNGSGIGGTGTHTPVGLQPAAAHGHTHGHGHGHSQDHGHVHGQLHSQSLRQQQLAHNHSNAHGHSQPHPQHVQARTAPAPVAEGSAPTAEEPDLLNSDGRLWGFDTEWVSLGI